VTTLVLLFFAMAMIFQKDTSTTELQFVRNNSEVFVHNAAQQRDYLFQDESGQTTYQGQMNNTGATTKTTGTMDSIDSLINPNEINQLI